MIKGFEQKTKPLTYEEKKLLPEILQGFKFHISKANIITSNEIIEKLKAKGYNISGPRLRKIINHIRCYSLAPICSNSNGYWQSIDRNEIIAEIQSLIDRRKAIEGAEIGLKKLLLNSSHLQ